MYMLKDTRANIKPVPPNGDVSASSLSGLIYGMHARSGERKRKRERERRLLCRLARRWSGRSQRWWRSRGGGCCCRRSRGFVRVPVLVALAPWPTARVAVHGLGGRQQLRQLPRAKPPVPLLLRSPQRLRAARLQRLDELLVQRSALPMHKSRSRSRSRSSVGEAVRQAGVSSCTAVPCGEEAPK